MKTLTIALATALVLVAASAVAAAGPRPSSPRGETPAIAERPARSDAQALSTRRAASPSNLYYRVRLSVDQSGKGKDGDLKLSSRSSWEVRSNAAILLEIVCTRRSTGELLAHEPCAKAFRNRRRPAGAVNDLAFGAAVGGVWEVHHREVTSAGTPESRVGDYLGRCTGWTRKLTLTKPVTFKGYLGSDSLLREGVSLTLSQPAVVPGESVVDFTGYKCTYTTLDGKPDRETVEPPDGGETPVTSTPPFDAEHLKRLRVRNVGVFGRRFPIKRTFQGGSVIEPEVTKITLVFTPCPRGGRAVERC